MTPPSPSTSSASSFGTAARVVRGMPASRPTARQRAREAARRLLPYLPGAGMLPLLTLLGTEGVRGHLPLPDADGIGPRPADRPAARALLRQALRTLGQPGAIPADREAALVTVARLAPDLEGAPRTRLLRIARTLAGSSSAGTGTLGDALAAACRVLRRGELAGAWLICGRLPECRAALLAHPAAGPAEFAVWAADALLPADTLAARPFLASSRAMAEAVVRNALRVWGQTGGSLLHAEAERAAILGDLAAALALNADTDLGRRAARLARVEAAMRALRGFLASRFDRHEDVVLATIAGLEAPPSVVRLLDGLLDDPRPRLRMAITAKLPATGRLG